MNERLNEILTIVALFFWAYLPYRVGRAEGKLSNGTTLNFHAPDGTEYEVIRDDGDKFFIMGGKAKSCSTCLWWSERPEVHEAVIWEKCNIADSIDDEPVKEGALFYGMTPSQDKVMVITHKTFHCKQWENRGKVKDDVRKKI